jgi:hypothetical protein
VIGDPSTKYGGKRDDNSAFIIGGSDITVPPLASPLTGYGSDEGRPQAQADIVKPGN